MIKTKKIKVNKVQEVIIDVICNKCGMSCIPHNAPKFLLKNGEIKSAVSLSEGLVETTIHAGYYSDFLEDGTIYRFSLCELCIRRLFNEFIEPVSVSNEATKGEFIPEKRNK